MIEFIQQYSAIILRPFVLIGWFLIYRKTLESKLSKQSIKLFLIFLLLFIIWNIFAISFSANVTLARNIYLFFWVVVTIYEFYLILKSLFVSLDIGKSQNAVLIIVLIVLSTPVILAAVLSHVKRTYNPINTTDFYNIILLLCGTVVIIRNILSIGDFVDNIESFFIFTGFALYFGLHILATNTVSLNFHHYWFFGQYATLISLIYWLGSVFFIWKIKSKPLF